MNALLDSRPQTDSAFPAMAEHGEVLAPEAPRDLAATGIDRNFLYDLTLKTIQTVPQGNTKWVADQPRLPSPLAEEMLQQMAREHLVEVLGLEGPFNHRYAITGRGHERAARLLAVSG